MLKEALQKEILSARTLDHHRNVLAAGCALTLFYWYPGIQWSELAFLGIKPPTSIDVHGLVMRIGWLLLLYFAVNYWYGLWWDWKTWWRLASEEAPPKANILNPAPFFGEWWMFAGRSLWPILRMPYFALTIGSWQRSKSENRETVTWAPTDADGQVRSERYNWRSLPYSTVVAVRRRVMWFIAIDLLLPFLALAVPLSLFLASIWISKQVQNSIPAYSPTVPMELVRPK